MEEQINEIAERILKEITEFGYSTKTTIKLAVIDGYRAGMEAARGVYAG